MLLPPVKITDVVLRDAHQSLFATRLRLEDMLPIAPKLDQVGYWSLESWGGATFDACIRFLGEDPWERIRELKKAMPNTPQQMLLRGQNLLGYRHYADDVVDTFVERAVVNGIDVFRVFDAMNDPRNLAQAMSAVKRNGAHAQGTMSYTTSPVHTKIMWLDLAKTIEDMGADSLAIKDMAGILTPYDAFELVGELKKSLSIPIALHAHATSGLSSMTILKAIEAGVDHVDTAISSMSMTYGHSPTESIVAALAGTPRDPTLDLGLLEEIATYFREVRKRYSPFEGGLRGVDARILTAQVPGGMLTNLEGQLKKQNALDRYDEVLLEIPKVRKDLGYIPLVTPTSQIVGTQAVINVITGTRYQSISKETQGILKGEYGLAPAPFNKELQKKVLDGAEPLTCRPADRLEPEMTALTGIVKRHAKDDGFTLSEHIVDDALTLALFPQVGLKFLNNRGDSSAFEPAPDGASIEEVPTAKSHRSSDYSVTINGQEYSATVNDNGATVFIDGKVHHVSIHQADSTRADKSKSNPTKSAGQSIKAPLAGTIFKVFISQGDTVKSGDTLIILEAMKMETEIKAACDGVVSKVHVQSGDSVSVGDCLINI